ncbi:MAG: TlyA family RNA methyltransferase [Rubrobacteridae bacterium]|nr:TlyA family RNA methyltransferase [Rubrobacteridae bacterium]
MAKKRADIYIVEKGITQSREKAQQLILDGAVLANGRPVGKPSSLIDEHSNIVLLDGKKTAYVSRGGLKLEKALKEFGVDVVDLNVIDIGASTGGFTDCLLKNGARHVTAVDVGYGQLAWSLRNDPRVTVMERTNIRNVSAEDFSELFDLATIDVSFISLDKILDVVVGLLKGDGEDGSAGSVVALVKPQFEAGRERVGKKGVVRDAGVHRDVLSEVWDAFERRELTVCGMTFSPIKGPEGNIEFLIYASRFSKCDKAVEKPDLIESVVRSAHKMT